MYPSAHPDNTECSARMACELAQRLEATLETPFVVWVKDEQWTTLNESPETVQLRSAASSLLVSSGAEQLWSGAATTARLSADQYLLVVPVPCDAAALRLVIGRINGHPPQLVQALANAQLLSLQQQNQLEQSRLQYEKCIYQITANFEELSWLRTFTEYIEIDEGCNNLIHVAQGTLPGLRQLVAAEAIYFFGAAESSSLSSAGCPLLFCEGDEFPAESVVQLIVDEAQANGRRQTWVCNSFDEAKPELQNLILTPVRKGESSLGWLVAVNKISPLTNVQDHTAVQWDRNLVEFGTVEAGLVDSMAAMLATQGRNVQLFRDLEELLVGVMRAMINAIDAKDVYTSGHSERVAAMSLKIAQQLGLSELECKHIHMAGLLHDVGKIGIPDNVLGKQGKLTDKEFAVVKLHPVIGYEILKPLDRIRFVLPGVLHHHEAWDGSGYPHGLRAEQIPLQARILAVADSYDAMTSDRPYRRGMPTSKAETILLEGMGSQWDSGVCEAFFAVLGEMQAICNKQPSFMPDMFVHAVPTEMSQAGIT